MVGVGVFSVGGWLKKKAAFPVSSRPRMVTSSLGQWWLCILVILQILLKTQGDLVNITYVNKAVAKGAVCLDGSPPAYHFDKGFGQGKKNWLLNLEGGAWCNNVTDCIARKSNIWGWGSSKLMWTQLNFTGILSNKSYFNPDFYNWNKVKIRYCDGASFTADVEAVDPDTNLYFRGARIFGVVMEELLAKGMKHAKNALLSGCSSGGLAVMFNCDRFRALLPKNTKVKCFSDAGFFLNAKDISGQPHIQEYFNQVVMTHELEKNLPPCCTSKMKAGLCFFPQNVAQNIKTPLFILNPAYDSWQIGNILVPEAADPQRFWYKCKLNIANCSASQLQTLHDFRMEFLSAITGLGSSSCRGLFINSCYLHCQSELQEVWLLEGSSKLRNTTMAKAVGDWFYERSQFQEIDCPYPCDKTCHNRIFLP